MPDIQTISSMYSISNPPTDSQGPSSPPETAQNIFSNYMIMHEIVSYFRCFGPRRPQVNDLISIALLSSYTSDIALRVLWKTATNGLKHILNVINYDLEDKKDKYLARNKHSKNLDNWIIKSPIPEVVQQRAQTYLSYIRHLTADPYDPVERNLWILLSAVLPSSPFLPHLQSLSIHPSYIPDIPDKPTLSPITLLLAPSLEKLEYHLSLTEWEGAMIHATLRGYGAELEAVHYMANRSEISSILVQHLTQSATKFFALNLNGAVLLDTETIYDIMKSTSLAKSLTCLEVVLPSFPRTDVRRRQFIFKGYPQLHFESLQELYLSCDNKCLDNHEFLKRLHCPSLLVLKVDVKRLDSWSSLFASVTHFDELQKLRINAKRDQAKQRLEATDIATMIPKSLLVLEIASNQSHITHGDLRHLVTALPLLHTFLYLRNDHDLPSRWYDVNKDKFSPIIMGKRTVNVYAPITLETTGRS